MIKIEQLYYLTQVAKYNSINKTADKLYMTSAAISTSIKQLEKECGFEILERTYRGVKLTEYGKEAVKIAEKILALEEEIRTLGKQKENNLQNHRLIIDRKTLKLLADKIIGPRAKVLTYFKVEEVSDVLVDYHQYLDDQTIVLTLFTNQQRENIENDPEINLIYLYASKCYPVSSKNTKWIKPNQTYISIEEFTKLPKILMSNAFEDAVGISSIRKNIVLSTDDATIYAEAIQNDYGIGLITKFAPDIHAIDCDRLKVYEPFDEEIYIAMLAKKGNEMGSLHLLENLIKD